MGAEDPRNPADVALDQTLKINDFPSTNSPHDPPTEDEEIVRAALCEDDRVRHAVEYATEIRAEAEAALEADQEEVVNNIATSQAVTSSGQAPVPAGAAAPTCSIGAAASAGTGDAEDAEPPVAGGLAAEDKTIEKNPETGVNTGAATRTPAPPSSNSVAHSSTTAAKSPTLLKDSVEITQNFAPSAKNAPTKEKPEQMMAALDEIFQDGKVDFKSGLEQWVKELESGKLGTSEEVAGFTECMKVLAPRFLLEGGRFLEFFARSIRTHEDSCRRSRRCLKKKVSSRV